MSEKHLSLLVWTSMAMMLAGSSTPPTPLLLTPILDAGQPELARNYSVVGPVPHLCHQSHAGLITADRALGNHLFFWFFPSVQNPDTSPLLVWLEGGPAESAMIGVFWSHGPLEAIRDLNGSVHVKSRQLFLAKELSIVYIDNPVGVGYSYSDSGASGYRLTASETKDDLYSFLDQFYQIFPEYKTRPLYIGGASVGAKFAVELAYLIHQEIEAGRSDFPLTGVFTAGGVFDPLTQVPARHDKLFGFGAESYAERNSFQNTIAHFVQKANNGELTNVTTSQLRSSLSNSRVISLINEVNYVTAEPFDVEDIGVVMRSKRIRSALHIGERLTYNVINEKIVDLFGPDVLRSVKDKFGVLLDNYKILVYDGDYDILIPVSGTENAILTTLWAGRDEYENSTRSIWTDTVQGRQQLRGYYTAVGEFCRVTVHGAGHWPAHDQPGAVVKMISDFVKFGCIRE